MAGLNSKTAQRADLIVEGPGGQADNRVLIIDGNIRETRNF